MTHEFKRSDDRSLFLLLQTVFHFVVSQRIRRLVVVVVEHVRVWIRFSAARFAVDVRRPVADKQLLIKRCSGRTEERILSVVLLADMENLKIRTVSTDGLTARQIPAPLSLTVQPVSTSP